VGKRTPNPFKKKRLPPREKPEILLGVDFLFVTE